MTLYLVDSDVLIDYLRLHPEAIRFLDSINRRQRALAFLSVFELLSGCSRKTQETHINRFIKQFRILELSPAISKTALQLYRIKRWSHGLGIPDSFIAATALVHKCTLVTRNTKHYKNIAGLILETPY